VTRQVVGVFARRGEGESLFKTPGGQRDGVAKPGKMKGKGSPPSPGTDNDDVHMLKKAENGPAAQTYLVRNIGSFSFWICCSKVSRALIRSLAAP